MNIVELREPKGVVTAEVKQCFEAVQTALEDCDNGVPFSQALIGHALLDVLAGAGESVGFCARSEALVDEAANVCLVAARWDSRCLAMHGLHLPQESRFDAVGLYVTAVAPLQPGEESIMKELETTSISHPEHLPDEVWPGDGVWPGDPEDLN